MKKTSDHHNEYAQMGIAALLPGMQYMLDLMQRALSERRDILTALQHGVGEVIEGKRRGRPPGAKNQKQNGWPADPEERKVEMLRRLQVREQNRRGKLHPRDKDHPGHAEWAAKMSKTQKDAWKKMSPAKRKARIAAMEAGKKTMPVVEMEKTA